MAVLNALFYYGEMFATPELKNDLLSAVRDYFLRMLAAAVLYLPNAGAFFSQGRAM
jgi:hypothetical protein